jgi:hypothetical protein
MGRLFACTCAAHRSSAADASGRHAGPAPTRRRRCVLTARRPERTCAGARRHGAARRSDAARRPRPDGTPALRRRAGVLTWCRPVVQPAGKRHRPRPLKSARGRVLAPRDRFRLPGTECPGSEPPGLGSLPASPGRAAGCASVDIRSLESEPPHARGGIEPPLGVGHGDRDSDASHSLPFRLIARSSRSQRGPWRTLKRVHLKPPRSCARVRVG